jgi:hypothetical protein
VLDDSVVRVKLWDADGRIVYSDPPELIATDYPLGEDELDAMRSSRIVAEVSDLSAPENRFERQYGKLLEVYPPLTVAGRRSAGMALPLSRSRPSARSGQKCSTPRVVSQPVAWSMPGPPPQVSVVGAWAVVDAPAGSTAPPASAGDVAAKDRVVAIRASEHPRAAHRADPGRARGRTAGVDVGSAPSAAHLASVSNRGFAVRRHRQAGCVPPAQREWPAPSRRRFRRDEIVDRGSAAFTTARCA